MSLANDLSSPKIIILTSQAQYADWALDVEAIALHGAYHDTLTGENRTTSTDEEAIEKVSSKEMKMKGLILRTVSQELKRELMDLTTTETSTTTPPVTTTRKLTAKEMWELLKSKFEKKVGATPLLDFKRFMRSKLVDDGTMEAQLTKLLGFRSTCALNGFKVDDWIFTTIILMSLPECYTNIADALLNASECKDLLIDTVKAKILDQEARYHQTGSSSSNHLLSTGNGKKKGDKKRGRPTDACNHCGELLTSRVSAKHTRRVSVKVWVVGLCSSGVCVGRIQRSQQR